MDRWLQSGLRRDVCVVVAANDEPTESAVKRALESHYGSRVRPKTFFGALDSLESKGLIERETDGAHARVSLTERGETDLRAHYEWMTDELTD